MCTRKKYVGLLIGVALVVVGVTTYGADSILDTAAVITTAAEHSNALSDSALAHEPFNFDFDHHSHAVSGDPNTFPHESTGQPIAAHSLTRVGPRRYTNLYPAGCSSSQLVESIKSAKVKPDGASRHDHSHPSGQRADALPSLDNFDFSFDLESCPQPHVFTPAEACDLLHAFGGVYIQGDGFMRQAAEVSLPVGDHSTPRNIADSSPVFFS